MSGYPFTSLYIYISYCCSTLFFFCFLTSCLHFHVLFFFFSSKFSYMFYATVAFISGPHVLSCSLPPLSLLKMLSKFFSSTFLLCLYFLLLSSPNPTLSLSSCSTSWAKVMGHAFLDPFTLPSIPFVFHVDSWPSLQSVLSSFHRISGIIQLTSWTSKVTEISDTVSDTEAVEADLCSKEPVLSLYISVQILHTETFPCFYSVHLQDNAIQRDVLQ